MSTFAWRDVKRQIIVVRSILSSKDISGDDRKKMERSIEDLQSLLETTFPDPGAFKDEILSRRDFLSKNFGLLDVFNTLWFIIHSHVNEDGALSQDGFFKIMYSIYVALCGFHSFDDIRNTLELEYYTDHKIFGPMTKFAFFDMLFEVIETWSELLHKSFLAAFSWALLDSIVDMNASLPRLKYIRDVRCIVQPMSEGDMIAKFNSNKKIKGSFSIGNEWMDRLPEVQRLLRSKKIVQAFAEKVSNMIDLRQNRSNGPFQGPFEDSDHESQSHGKVDLYLMQASKDRRVVSTDGDEDDKSGGSTENNDDSSFNGSVSSQQLTNSRSHKLNTMSFIEYLKGRRNARHQLNGDMPSILSQSRSGVLSINSLEFDSLPGTAVAPPQQSLSLLSSNQSHSKSVLFGDSQTVDHHSSAVAIGMGGSTDTMGVLDVVGKNILGKPAGNSSVGGRKTELPMKNVILDMAAIAHGAGNSKYMKGPTSKQKHFDATSAAVRNGFNSDLGMLVRPLSLPGAAVTMGDPSAPGQPDPSSSFHIQQLSLQGCIAPASEASTALAELKRNRKNILIPTTSGVKESEHSLAAQSVASGRNDKDNDASVRSLAKTPEQAAVATTSKGSMASGRAVSPMLIMSDELINSPTELGMSFKSDTPDDIDLDSRSIRTDISAECGPLTMKSDFGVEDLSMLEPVNIKSVDESKFEQSLSPPKLSSPEQSRHILGPFPSAYFLSSGNSSNSVATAANSRVGALPSSFLAGFPQLNSTAAPSSMKHQHRGDSSSDSSNHIKDASKAPPVTAPTESTQPVHKEKQAHDYIITAYPLSTNSRGIFKGLASVSSADRDRDWHRPDNKPTSAAMIMSQQQMQQRFPNTESSSSLPNAPTTKLLSRSPEGSQSIPSLLIRPVTAIQRSPPSISLRKERFDQDRTALASAAAAMADFRSDGSGGGGGVVSAGVINDSVKSLTMLSNSQFEHLKNSIEVSVGGGHLPTYGSSSSSNAKNSSSTISPVKRPQSQLALQQVSPSPVRYECHQSFLSISGSKDSNFTSSGTGTQKNFHSRNFLGNSSSVFSNAANNALNSGNSDPAGDTATRSAVLVDNGKYEVSYNNETVVATTAFHLKQDFPHAPWVPQELLIPLDHNRSNRILGWREKLESLKSIPHIPAKVTMTIKSQDAVRVSFEEFVKRKNGKYK